MLKYSKVQLILEGGGMRSSYTMGVLDFFMEKKIIFKDIIGVSAGVGAATSYISNQPKRNIDVMLEYINDKRYISFRNLFLERSMFGMNFIFREIPEDLVPLDYECFNNSPSKLTAVVTNVETGKPEYYKITDLKEQVDYVIASSSLPLVAKMVKIGDKKFLDGGISDAIPYNHSLLNFDKQVIILTRNFSYRKREKVLSSVMRLEYNKYPLLLDALHDWPIVYNRTVEKIEEDEVNKKIIVIRPTKPMVVDKFERNKEKLKEIYDMGYNDAKAKYEELIEYCKDCNNFEIKGEE